MNDIFKLLCTLYAAFCFVSAIFILTCDFIKPLMRFGFFVFLTIAGISIFILAGTI